MNVWGCACIEFRTDRTGRRYCALCGIRESIAEQARRATMEAQTNDDRTLAGAAIVPQREGYLPMQNHEHVTRGAAAPTNAGGRA